MPLSILLQSNAPWVASGYGASTKYLVNIWRSMGHRVGIFASYGIEGAPFEYDGFPIFARGHQQWGGDVMPAHAEKFGADVVISNIDTFVLSGHGTHKVPWIPIAPVMEDPLTGGIRHSLRGAKSIVSISEYGQETLKDDGFATTLIPLPVDTGKFFPINKRAARKLLGFPEDAFIIGNVGMNRGNRKAQDMLMRAFTRVLVDLPKAILYLHTDMQQPDGLDLMSLMKTLGLTQSQIYYPSRYNAFYGQPQDWMNAMYSALSLYIQPSRNEGQAMPLWEALSSGLPVVGTDATAISEVLRNSEAIGLPVVNKGWLPGTGYAYDTSEEAIYSAILRAYERWGTDYVSAHNRQNAIDHVSLPVIGFKWQDFLIDIEKQQRFTAPPIAPMPIGVPLKMVQASTLVANCGVGAYTRSLVAGLESSGSVETIEIRSLVDPDQISPETTLLHVQYEPSIAPPNGQLEKVMRALRERGVRVVITYHNLSEMINDHLGQEMVDMALIHWPSRGMKISDPRVRVLGGMGVPVFTPPRFDSRAHVRKAYGFGPDDVVISTFGFASLGRGHFELPYELAGTLKGRENLKLQLLLPANFMNEEGKNYVHGMLNALRADHGLEKQIIPVDDFLPDSEVLLRLWMSDVGYLYLEGDTHSSSSALRFFIASRLPVVVTPSSHFGDVKRGVMITDGFSMAEFTNAVLGLAADGMAQDRLRREHEDTYRKWQWPEFAQRHLAIYKELLQS